MSIFRAIRPLLGAVLDIAVALPMLPCLYTAAFVARMTGGRHTAPVRPRVLIGTTPLASVMHNTAALRAAGYTCESAVTELYDLLSVDAFDHVLGVSHGQSGLGGFLLHRVRAYSFFIRALWHYDVFHFFFDGGVLRHTIHAQIELKLLALAGKKTVIMPYGSDAFVYDRIPDPVWRHALMASYPHMGRHARRIESRIRTFCQDADIVLACLVHFVCLPRWDILPLVCYPTNVQDARVRLPSTDGPVRIVHAPNHRGTKGTSYLIAAVERLREEGHLIEIDLIERVPHAEALARIDAADIVVEQLHFGFALTALEAMARGKIVISRLQRDDIHRLFSLESHLDACPIIEASATTIEVVLRDLLEHREDWPERGDAMRRYVEEFHSYSAIAAMWQAIHDQIWNGQDIDLMAYHRPDRNEFNPETGS